MRRLAPRWRDIPVSLVALASLAILTAWAAHQISDDRINWHCESDSCVHRFTTGKSVFLCLTLVIPMFALILVWLARHDRQFWSRIGWLLFVVILLAIVAYGLWVNAPMEVISG